MIRNSKNLLKSAFMMSLAAISMLLMLPGCAPQITPELREKIKQSMTDKRMDIFEFNTGDKIRFRLNPNTGYVLAVKQSGLTSVRNHIQLTYRQYYQESTSKVLVEFRFDKTKGVTDEVVPSPQPDSLKLWYFIIPDVSLFQETGVMEAHFQYKKNSASDWKHVYQYYDYIDETPDTVLVQNIELPLKTYAVRAAHLGDQSTNQEIMKNLERLRKNFRYAAKEYVMVTTDYIGRQSLPDNNADVAGKVHNYLEWWNSVSHDLANTNLLPLDPNNPDDFELIKLAWYTVVANRPQMIADAKEIFGLQTDEDAVITFDAPKLFSGGPGNAYIGLYNEKSFMEVKNGVEQWGVHKDYAKRSTEANDIVMLHELGHCTSGHHPGDRYFPYAGSWDTEVKMMSLESFYNIMATSAEETYPTNHYFTDKHIGDMLAPGVDSKTLEKLARPYMIPAGDPAQNPFALKGWKEAGASVKIDDLEVVAANSSTTWEAPKVVKSGVNHFDVTQKLNNKYSAPYPVFVTRSEEAYSEKPALTLSTYPQGSTFDQGESIRLNLNTTCQNPLKRMWWWLEKKGSNNQYTVLSDTVFTEHLYGAVQGKKKFNLSVPDPGTYKICVRSEAEDGFPNRQSDIVEKEIEIQ